MELRRTIPIFALLNKSTMIREESYKGQKIIVCSDNSAAAYLFNEDGEIVSLSCDNLEEAISRIDKFEKTQGGLYDANGELN